MADNYQFPGNANTYVPTLTGNLLVEFVRSPQSFPINKYIKTQKVEKEVGYWVKMKNQNQGRFGNAQDTAWPDGNDRPVLSTGNDPFEFLAYRTQRYDITKKIGYLAVEQGSWDVLDQMARNNTQQLMTGRSKRLHSTLTTSGNWPSANTATATSLGGGVWSAATSALPYIRKSIQAAVNTIIQQTFGVVQYSELFMVINPNTAQEIALSAEFIDFLKQSPVSYQIWEGQQQFVRHGIPEQLFGVNVVVDDTVYDSSAVTLTGSGTKAFTFPDNTAVIMSKPDALSSVAGSFSTMVLHAYEELSVEVYNDVLNRLYAVSAVENVVEQLVSGESGFLITST